MAEPEHNWKFAQCFGDKGDSDDITEGMILFFKFCTNPTCAYPRNMRLVDIAS